MAIIHSSLVSSGRPLGESSIAAVIRLMVRFFTFDICPEGEKGFHYMSYEVLGSFSGYFHAECECLSYLESIFRCCVTNIVDKL
jgi:hypothetical protein